MEIQRSKIGKIRELVSRFNNGVRHYPATWGSIEQIEAQFFIIDELYQILSCNHVDNSELSWRAFLLFKGDFGSRRASEIIRDRYPYASYTRLYDELNSLMDEYFKWRDLKIGSLDSPEDNGLLDILRDVDDDKADIMTTWFIKHPSDEALSIYKNRSKERYADFHRISLCLASMNDVAVLSWAVENITNKRNRCLALQLISASPKGDVDDVVYNAIQNKEIEDITCIVRGYCFSGNSSTVVKQIGFIIEKVDIPQLLHLEMDMALCGPAHCDKKEAIALREKLMSLSARESLK